MTRPPLADTPSALEPAGSGAERIADLWWFLLAAGMVVYVVVVVMLVVALRRRSRRDDGDGRRAVLVGGIVLPAIVIVAVAVVTLRPDGALFALGGDGEVTVEVTGRQWWWEVRYPEQGIVTANEIHVPVGRDVRVELTSTDVVHSFWIPELNGKLDALPGSTNALTLHARRPGVYRGACAEFCGVQHALMGVRVVAQRPEEFERWSALAAEAAAEPASPQARRGERVFMEGTCAACHTIRGTPARGRAGPDLTHLAGRRTLGAGAVPNTRGHLGGWIVDAQAIKPGNKMPPQDLDAEELSALLAYLEGLR